MSVSEAFHKHAEQCQAILKAFLDIFLVFYWNRNIALIESARELHDLAVSKKEKYKKFKRNHRKIANFKNFKVI